MSNPKPFPTLAEFFFSFPLYARADMTANWKEARFIFYKNAHRIDGYCIGCGASTTFKVLSNSQYTGEISLDSLGDKLLRVSVELECQRKTYHGIYVIMKRTEGVITKIGQYPSLADIANDESKKYAKVLKSEDAAEFHRAIGLAAHGVGIGSYVYLRRIFERLVNGRFAEFKDTEGWTDEQYARLRMDDRIELLKNHLPRFLVENRKVYSILSQGIHELDEDTCRGLFPVLKLSISVILDEDEKKREELRLKEELAKAIRGFTPGAKGTG